MKRVVARSRAPTPQIQDKLYWSKLAELSQTISGCKKIHTIANFHSHLQPLHFFSTLLLHLIKACNCARFSRWFLIYWIRQCIAVQRYSIVTGPFLFSDIGWQWNNREPLKKLKRLTTVWEKMILLWWLVPGHANKSGNETFTNFFS